jgi:hypothetical protein
MTDKEGQSVFFAVLSEGRCDPEEGQAENHRLTLLFAHINWA